MSYLMKSPSLFSRKCSQKSKKIFMCQEKQTKHFVSIPNNIIPVLSKRIFSSKITASTKRKFSPRFKIKNQNKNKNQNLNLNSNLNLNLNENEISKPSHIRINSCNNFLFVSKINRPNRIKFDDVWFRKTFFKIKDNVNKTNYENNKKKNDDISNSHLIHFRLPSNSNFSKFISRQRKKEACIFKHSYQNSDSFYYEGAKNNNQSFTVLFRPKSVHVYK